MLEVEDDVRSSSRSIGVGIRCSNCCVGVDLAAVDVVTDVDEDDAAAILNSFIAAFVRNGCCESLLVVLSVRSLSVVLSLSE